MVCCDTHSKIAIYSVFFIQMDENFFKFITNNIQNLKNDESNRF